MLTARLKVQIAHQRVALLAKAVDTITQRVNLFDKVLIPNARSNIKKIRIYLSDEQTSAVTRSKIAKRKRAAL
jgi:V/A-type H+-transporting ATPase subunit D